MHLCVLAAVTGVSESSRLPARLARQSSMSVTNLLWWLHSRGGVDDGVVRSNRCCWYRQEAALAKTRALASHDDGNTLTNLLWWLHSHGGIDDGVVGCGRCCWYRRYGH